MTVTLCNYIVIDSTQALGARKHTGVGVQLLNLARAEGGAGHVQVLRQKLDFSSFLVLTFNHKCTRALVCS